MKGWIGKRLEGSIRGRYARDREAMMTVGERTSVDDVFTVFKGVVTSGSRSGWV